MFRGRRTSRISRYETFLLYFSIFFTFSAVGWIMAIFPTNPTAGMGTGFYYAMVSGACSCMWAYCFISTRYGFLPFVAVVQYFGPYNLAYVIGMTGLFEIGMGGTDRQKSARLALCAGVFIIVGYVLSIVLSRRITSRTVRQQAELDVAAQMHLTLVPPIDRHAAGLSIFGRSDASTEMGGDLIDIVLNGEQTDVFLADVSGHGVRAGVLMAMVKSAIRTRLLGGAPLADLVGALNEVVGQVKEASMFVTFAALRFHGPRRFEYTSAGHLPILWYRAALGEVRGLYAENLPLGVDDSEAYVTAHAECESGDLLVLYTDGLTEVMDAASKQFGLREFRELVRAHTALPLGDMHARVMDAIRAHGPQTDDQSLLLVRVN